jgi:hypothetical protein
MPFRKLAWHGLPGGNPRQAMAAGLTGCLHICFAGGSTPRIVYSFEAMCCAVRLPPKR